MNGTNPASLRRLGRNTMLYGFGALASRVIGVVMLPVYTRYLAPAQYGLLQLLDITVEITTIIFRAGTASGLQRFFYKAPTEDEKRRVAFSAFALHIAGTIAGTVALILATPLIHTYLLRGAGDPGFVRIAALNFFLSALIIVPETQLQIEQRAGTVLGLQLGKLLLQVALNVYFLVFRGMGVASMLWSTAIASVLSGASLTAIFLRRAGTKGSWSAVRDLRRFGVPYQVTVAAAFILTFGDRFFLQHYSGAAAVGLYSLAYQFNFLLSGLTAGPFQRAWDPQRFALLQSAADERDAATRRGFLFFNLLMLSVALGIVVFARPALTALTDAAYHEAGVLVPLIIVAGVLQNWGGVMKFGIDASERTWLMTRAVWGATVVIVVAYALLIPPFGAIGAALATIIGYAARLGLIFYWAQRAHPVRYGWNRSIMLASAATVIAAPAVIWPPAFSWNQVFLGATLTVGYALVVWRLILTAGERTTLLTAVKKHSFAALVRG